MFGRLATNVKSAWAKTVQEFQEFEAQQNARKERKRRADQARSSRTRYTDTKERGLQNAALSSLANGKPVVASRESHSNPAGSNVDLAESEELDDDDEILIYSKRRKIESNPGELRNLDGMRESSSSAPYSDFHRSLHLQQTPQSQQQQPQKTQQENIIPSSELKQKRILRDGYSEETIRRERYKPGTIESILRNRIFGLERELRDAIETIQLLKNQVEEQDEYIRAMEFERSRMQEDTRSLRKQVEEDESNIDERSDVNDGSDDQSYGKDKEVSDEKDKEENEGERITKTADEQNLVERPSALISEVSARIPTNRVKEVVSSASSASYSRSARRMGNENVIDVTLLKQDAGRISSGPYEHDKEETDDQNERSFEIMSPVTLDDIRAL
ncbi:hypothetical protein V1511DRAFT_485276 [Dipodascopsis uninucleata]